MWPCRLPTGANGQRCRAAPGDGDFYTTCQQAEALKPATAENEMKTVSWKDGLDWEIIQCVPTNITTRNKNDLTVDLSMKRLCVCVWFTKNKPIKMLKMRWSLVSWCAEVEGRINGSTLSRQVSVYFNLHIHISSHLQTASGGHLLTQDYQSTRGPSGCALGKIRDESKLQCRI